MERRDTHGMQRKFKPAFNELDKLENKILKTRGFIVKWHVHSIEDLLQSMHHQKLYAITAVVGTDVSNWRDAGNLSDEESETYFLERNALEKRLSAINKMIELREPTWWESMKYIFLDFNFMVISNLPIIKLRKTPRILKSLLLPFRKFANITKSEENV